MDIRSPRRLGVLKIRRVQLVRLQFGKNDCFRVCPLLRMREVSCGSRAADRNRATSKRACQSREAAILRKRVRSGYALKAKSPIACCDSRSNKDIVLTPRAAAASGSLIDLRLSGAGCSFVTIIYPG